MLAGKANLKPSDNDYDWLGSGIYFWADSPKRAWDWAHNKSRSKEIRTPFVVGALIYPGLCLNLTDYGVIDELRVAHRVLASSVEPGKMPRNTLVQDGAPMLRQLDCAVMETLHRLRRKRDEEAYDSVFGVFDEGLPVYGGAGFREKTHIQLAVRNPAIIDHYFRVDTSEYVKSSGKAR